MKRLLARLKRMRADDNGAAAIGLALLSPVMIGGMALGAETGYWYFTQRKLQHAADVAAHAAGTRKRAGDTIAGMRVAALDSAKGSGFLPLMDNSTSSSVLLNLKVNNPPVAGAFKGKPEAVEVTLGETHPRMLSSIFLKEPVQIGARAVARIVGGTQACVLALSETSARAVEVSGSSSATLKGCSVASNSVQPDAYYMPNSSAYLSADCIHTVGGSVIKESSIGTLDLKTCSSVQEQAPKTLDPYAEVPEPTYDPSKCTEGKNLTGKITPVSGTKCFYGNVTLGSVEFEPGLYIIDGGTLSVNAGAVVRGHGVTFFLAKNATVDFSGHPELDLSAPAPGNLIPATAPYAGILFFGARCNPVSDPTSCQEVSKIRGHANSSLQGAIYLPGSNIEFLGDSTSTNACLQIIADKVTFTGNSTLTMGVACSTTGTKPVLVNQIVKLVE